MKKALIIVTAILLTLSIAGPALAVGDITPTTYDMNAMGKIWFDNVNGTIVTYNGSSTSTHIWGTWNSPYTGGVDGFNYNDAQDYTEEKGFASGFGNGNTTVEPTDTYGGGPHGGYMTTTHRCRECHAVHRAAGKFKLMRTDTRFEACDWCHGFGAGSGFNVQMDNDDGYTREFNVGHTIGFGVSSGKWKAPDDTFPAYTTNYWQGGFSCFDCHSPHANPQRLLGFNSAGVAVGLQGTDNTGVDPLNRDQRGLVFSIADPGHDTMGNSISTNYYNLVSQKNEPVYLAGSWLLIKDADRETAVDTEPASVDLLNGTTGTWDSTTIAKGQEIPDGVMQGLYQFDSVTSYPVNKVPIDWNDPVGSAGSSAPGQENQGYDSLGTKNIWNVSEFCTDCHDGNAGLHTVQAPLFSEDRALRDQSATDTVNWKGEYDLAYGHDSQPRH